MSELRYAPLPERGVLAVAGADARAFLQGLVSNDVHRATAERAIYAALLTPQGKYLFDFLIAQHQDTLLLDVERGRLNDLLRRLGLYRLRAKVTIADVSDRFAVAAAFGPGAPGALGLADAPGAARAFAGGVAFTDPRVSRLGARVVAPPSASAELESLGFAAADATDYDRLRLAQGVPDGSRDLVVEKSFLLENNFEELNGVDFDKGCYVGQELTARTKFRGVVRKRLYRVEVEGPLPAPGTPVMLGETQIGTMRTGRDRVGLAFLRLEAVAEAAGAPLLAGAARLTPIKPDWARF
jgi:folate-binding protein YgfZ